MEGFEEEEYDVAVFGGGVGGAALGLRLAQLGGGVKFVVLEKDAEFSSRSQGYGLTIQHHDALRVLELWETCRREDTVNDAHFIFLPSGVLCSVFGRFMDAVWEKKKKTKENKKDTSSADDKRYNVHLPRQRLRELLIDRLQRFPGVMQWGWKCDRLEEDDEWVRVIVKNSAQQQRRLRARVVVGADGIYSVVRRARMEQINRADPLVYLGMLVVLGMTPSKHPLCLRTTFQTLDGDTRLFTMPFTVEREDEDGKITGKFVTFWQLSFPCSEQEAQRLKNDLPALRAEIARRCNTWHDPVPSLLNDAPSDMITATPVYDRGEAYPFLRTTTAVCGTSRMTLIGDAAHPMSPFKGQGANQALLDAVLLGETLHALFTKVKDSSPSRADVLAALAKAETLMYHRSDKKVRQSREVAIRLHSSDAAHDPATRGVSQPMLELFEREKIGAWLAKDDKLRQMVIECVVRAQKKKANGGLMRVE